MTTSTHFTTTRKTQRTLTKYLKTLGLHAASKGTKQAGGWCTSVSDVIIRKPVKSVLKSLSGRLITVIVK